MPGDDIDRLMMVMGTAFDPAFGEAWSRRQVEDALLIGNCCYGLVDGKGCNLGLGLPAAGFWLSRPGFGEEELLLFAVDPQYRLRGIGKAMLASFAAAASQRGATRLLLEMRKGNPAEVLYRGFGFEPIGERPNYYRGRDGIRISAITFELALK